MPRDRYDEDDDDDRPRSRRRRDEEDDDRPRRRSRREDDEDDDFDRPKKKSGSKTLVIVLGILGGVLLVCGGGLALLVYPAYKKFEESKARFESTNNMKRVGIAFHNHHAATGRLHAPFHEDPTAGFQPGPPPGNLSDKLSWRVSVLPYLDQKSLSARFDAKQPWNGSTNQPLANTVVPEYVDADTPTDPTTRTRLFYDNGALFDADRGRRAGLTGITDGTSNTLAYVESADKVGWTQFNDFRFDPTGAVPPLGKANASVFLAVFADGSVRQVRKTVNPQALKAAITRAGGETMRLDD